MAPYTYYTWTTPNGWKVSIMLEELGLDYKTKPVDLWKNEQKEPWFTAINPNGRIPALVDHENADHSVFETGSIMWYLAEKEDRSGKLWPKDFSKRSEVMSWLMFQMGGLGPMQGQANFLTLFAPVKVPYAIERYLNETKRLFSVLDKHLEKNEWLAAGQYTIADIANFSWVFIAAWVGIDRAEYPHLQRWHDKILERPAVRRGLAVPHSSDVYEMMVDPARSKKAMQDAWDIVAEAKAAAAGKQAA